MSDCTIECWSMRPRAVFRRRGKKHVVRNGWHHLVEVRGYWGVTYYMDGLPVSRRRALLWGGSFPAYARELLVDEISVRLPIREGAAA